MSDVRHVRMKIGDAEFEADVPADSVQSMYDRFLAAVEKKPAPAAAIKADPPKPNEQTPLGNGVDEALLARMFELRQDGVVTLRLLPKTDDREADAFLLILYGYRRLKQQDEVLATQLLAAAEYSGLSAYRPAHALASHDRYVRRGGVKKGSWYSLNNQGVTKAEEIAAKMFD
jgi:hypothetical protein